MITPNELRIGNYLYIHGSHAPIQAGWFCLIGAGKNLPDHEPIPLTPEWLERFGFKKYIYHEERNLRHAYIIPNEALEHIVLIPFADGHGVVENNFCIKDQRKSPMIKHVHQLQNLYFALTGEELKIKG